MSSSFDLADVNRLTTGTVGPPGQRVFYLQASDQAQVVTLRLEKELVAGLVHYLGELLADLSPPGPLPTDMELVEPVVAEWVVGGLGASYDETRDRIVLVAEELVENESEERATARFAVTREQAAALARHGAAVVAAGRPPCALCGQPLDPEGHLCVRLNGHRKS